MSAAKRSCDSCVHGSLQKERAAVAVGVSRRSLNRLCNNRTESKSCRWSGTNSLAPPTIPARLKESSNAYPLFDVCVFLSRSRENDQDHRSIWPSCTCDRLDKRRSNILYNRDAYPRELINGIRQSRGASYQIEFSPGRDKPALLLEIKSIDLL